MTCGLYVAQMEYEPSFSTFFMLTVGESLQNFGDFNVVNVSKGYWSANLLVPEGIITFSKTSNTWFWMLKFVNDATFKYIFHF